MDGCNEYSTLINTRSIVRLVRVLLITATELRVLTTACGWLNRSGR